MRAQYALILAVVLYGQVGYVEAQAHRGQMDTDGILSPGEIPNPRIDYSKNRRPNTRNNNTPPNPHAGQVDTDGILSPGEIRNPLINYGDQNNNRPIYGGSGSCSNLGAGSIPRPHVDIDRVKSTGNFFGDKVKVRGSVEGTCIAEAGLFEKGRKVESIPVNTVNSFGRFEFEVKAHLDKDPEIRVYNTAGERDEANIEAE